MSNPVRQIQLRSNPTLAARFWQRVVKTPDCWVWSGCRYGRGYGHTSANDPTTQRRHGVSAHRVSWLLQYGSLPQDKEIMHRCDNRACVRPDHLQAGTHQENMRDCADKGRIHLRISTTHCRNGHPALPGNFSHATGVRICRLCRQAVRKRNRLHILAYRRQRYALFKRQGFAPKVASQKR